MRAWSGLIRTATILAPLAILLFWGGSFLLACAEFLANPGVPLKFTYKAAAGNLLITAESYVLNTKTGDLTVIKPRVLNAKGWVLFYADRIEAQGLPLARSETRRAIVTASNAYATVQRKSDGNLDIFDYLPKQEGPSGDFPFSVNLNRGQIKFVDLTGTRRFTQTITVNNILVDGVGDRWLASGSANLDRVGVLSWSAQNQPASGFWVSGQTKQLELIELFRAFRDTPEGRNVSWLGDLEADSLVARGPFELFVPSKAGTRLQATLSAEAVNFRFGRDYRAEKLNFDGQATADGVSGKLRAEHSGLSAELKGTADWQNGLQLGGNLEANAASMASLPDILRSQVPRELVIRGPMSFQGQLRYSESPGWQVKGLASMGAIAAYKETVVQPSLDLDYNQDRLVLASRTASWRGSKVLGNVAIDLKQRGLTGSLAVSKVDFGKLAKRFDVDRLAGTGNLNLLLTGTTSKPIAHIRVDSTNSFSWSPKVPTNSGRFALAATIKDNRVQIEQAYLVTQAGSISTSGSYDLKTQALNLSAVGSGIDLDRLDPELEGIGRFRAGLGGTLSKPTYQGSAELFGLMLRGQPIPIVTTTFRGDRNAIFASNLRAIKGASQAQGEITVRFRDQALSGTFQALGVQLSDFLGDDYLATIDLPDARLSGTIGKPTFNANATASQIVILGSRIDSAKAVVSFQNNLVQIDGFEARKKAGTMEGFLSYDWQEKFGQANFTAKDLAISELLPPEIGANMVAKLTGEGGLTFDENGFTQGSGEGVFADVEINGTKIGGGDWKISSDGKDVKGDAFLGGLRSSLDLTKIQYNIAKREILGNVWVRNLPIPDLYKIISPYYSISNADAAYLLSQTEGTLGISADLGGTLDAIQLQNGGFSAEGIRNGIHDLGSIKSSFSRSLQTWSIGEFDWQSPSLNLGFSGTFQESGDINITGQLQNADLNLLALVDSGLSSVVGRVNSKFSILGTTSNPEVVATVDQGSAYSGSGTKLADVNEDGIPSGQTPTAKLPEPFTFQTPVNSPLRISNWREDLGGLVGKLELGYLGQKATLDFQLPFRFPFDLVPGAPVAANLILSERDVKDIFQFDEVIDTKASSGKISGNVKVTGTKEDLLTTGGFSLVGSKLVFRAGDQVFRDFQANLLFRPEELQASAVGVGGAGGGFTFSAKAAVPTLDELIKQFRDGNLEELWSSPLTGSFTAPEFKGKINVGVDGSVGGTIAASLQLGGSLRQPLITGNVGLSNAAILMPSEFVPPSGSSPLGFPGILNVKLATKGPVKFKSSTAELDLEGTGTLQGSVADLDLDALLRVQRGNLKLPTARVTIEPGGTIRPTYTISNGVSSARLDVELEGKTRVVASKVGVGAQRYDVNLDVRGDLLQDGGLSLTATSDPPELTQDEILALLGQVSLIQGIASGVQRGNAESQIRDALFGIAVPYLLDPFTSKVASAIGLDYLTLDINPLDGASLYFARTISKNLVLQGSRQVTQVNEAFPLRYDIRLAYQLRIGRTGDRKRWNFLVGRDETRPWKIAVEYTFRF